MKIQNSDKLTVRELRSALFNLEEQDKFIGLEQLIHIYMATLKKVIKDNLK